MLKEAQYYEKLNELKVKCLLCPHECIISEGKAGFCLVRKNINGQLFTLAYSNPCAINIDPVEKKPLYHFLPGTKTFSFATAGCNLKCDNCQNYTISQVGPENINNYTYSPEKIIESTLKSDCKSISYTYTEPLVSYEYTLETAKLAKQKNLKNIIVSAGYINQKPLEELLKYIDAANIDLKSFDNNIYKKINKVSLQPVLDNLLLIKNSNVWLEITYLIIPSINDSLEMISKMCEWLIQNGFENTPIHFSKFFPQYKLTHIKETPDETIIKAVNKAQTSGFKYVYSGNLYFDKNNNTYCNKCGKILIKRVGFGINEYNLNKNLCKFCGNSIDGLFLQTN